MRQHSVQLSDNPFLTDQCFLRIDALRDRDAGRHGRIDYLLGARQTTSLLVQGVEGSFLAVGTLFGTLGLSSSDYGCWLGVGGLRTRSCCFSGRKQSVDESSRRPDCHYHSGTLTFKQPPMLPIKRTN
jgi:hypothetical protein